MGTHLRPKNTRPGRRGLFQRVLLPAAVCLAAVFSFSAAISAERQPAAATDPADLVRQLGDPAYVVREQASRELARLGPAARDALMAALRSDDEEIRYRARQLLIQVLEEDLALRLEAFAADTDGDSDPDLPGWRAYKSEIGNALEHRRFFVEMVRAEPILMEALDRGPAEAHSVLLVRCQALQEEMQHPQLNSSGQQVPLRVSVGTIGAFFLVAADEQVAIDENLGRMVQTLLYQSSFQADINSGPRAEPLRRLLGRWIVRNRSTSMAYQGLHFAMQYNLKEGHELAEHLIRVGGQPANLLQTAVLVLGRFGSEDDLPLLAPLLRDESPLQFGQPAEFQQELRDVALAVSIHLSGQELRDYGFNRAALNPQMLFNPSTLVFSSAATREAALRKWDAWQSRREQQDAEG